MENYGKQDLDLKSYKVAMGVSFQTLTRQFGVWFAALVPSSSWGLLVQPSVTALRRDD